MAKVFFVTGTDTGVGKTRIACTILKAAASQGLNAFGLKPVAAGCELQNGKWVNDDALQLIGASTVKLPYEQVNPIALREPVAPHIAAAHEGKRLSLDHLEGYVRGALMHKADLIVIEGAGGWRVPIDPQHSLASLCQRLQIPVILVVGMRLGCINHALLTAEAIRRDGLMLTGWVANIVDNEMAALDENLGTLAALLGAPCLGKVPNTPEPAFDFAADYISLDFLTRSA